MGTYSEWDEEKKLEFLTRELKGKRPLVPPTIEVRCLDTPVITEPRSEGLLEFLLGNVFSYFKDSVKKLMRILQLLAFHYLFGILKI